MKIFIFQKRFTYSCNVAAEYLAQQYGVSRKRQDEFAAHSQHKAEIALLNGYFDLEIAPVMSDKTREIVLKDEFPRPGTTVDKLLNLKPCFTKKDAPMVGSLFYF